MAYKSRVSDAVIRRLPMYYRHLRELEQAGVVRISSQDLGEKMNLTASQIRQDINCFGGFGQQGYGYNVEMLHAKIGNILGIDRGYKMIIVGAGHLGHALANHHNFQKRGFTLVGIYDTDDAIIGTDIAGIKVESYDDIPASLADKKPHIAILAVPKAAVNDVAEKLVENGITAMLNFTYAELDLPEHVIVENMHISDTLMTLSYGLTEKSD